MTQVIDVSYVVHDSRSDTGERSEPGVLFVLWTRLTRRAKRAWMRMPRRLRLALGWTLVMMAWFIGYITMFVTIVIAFDISVLLGLLVTFMWLFVVALIFVR